MAVSIRFSIATRLKNVAKLAQSIPVVCFFSFVFLFLLAVDSVRLQTHFWLVFIEKKTLWNFAFSHIDSTWTSWFVIEITIFFLDLFKKKMIRKTLIGNQAKLLAIFWWFFFRILKLRSIDSLSLSLDCVNVSHCWSSVQFQQISEIFDILQKLR